MARLKDLIRQTKPFSSPEEETMLTILRTADVLGYRLAQFFKKRRLTPTQYNVLRIVRGAGAPGALCSEVGARLITRVPDVTRLLDRLERQGLIARERQLDDRRAVRVRLTRKGSDLLARIDPEVEAFHRECLKHMPRKALAQLNELLDRARKD